jgi:hypothetical protein
MDVANKKEAILDQDSLDVSEPLRNLSELQLALVGGGIGEVVFG